MKASVAWRRAVAGVGGVALVGVIGLGAAVPADAGSWTATDLGTLGGGWSAATAVSGSLVVGSSELPSDPMHPMEDYSAYAYDLTDHTWTNFNMRYSMAYGVSGSVVVGVQYDGPVEFRAFMYDLKTHTPTYLPTLGGTNNLARGVSGNVVVGESMLVEDADVHAFAYDLVGHTMKDLGTLGGRNSSARAVSGRFVVGDSSIASDAATHAFLYNLSSHTMTDLWTMGCTLTSARGLSGHVVVGIAPGPGGSATHAFACDLTRHTMIDLGTLGGTTSDAAGVSGHLVVGSSLTAGNAETHAFVYDLTTKVMTDLGTPGAGSQAYGVSGRLIVGSSTVESSAQTHATLWRWRNAAPKAGRVSIAPHAGVHPGAVEFAATPSGFTDADGDALSYHYGWTLNGAKVGGDSPNVTLQVAAKDVVSVRVWATDGARSSRAVLDRVSVKAES